MVMAGNPYTESGEAFKIPDMLANRADFYNLGDVLSGREAAFSLSYVENSLTANPALQALTSCDPKDIDRLLRLAQGADVAASEFSHAYSAAEIGEIIGILRHLFTVRDVLLKVNQAYIQSAAQEDDYRTEPPFKLQGSYRNMAKLAAKVTAILEPQEIDDLLRDHYRGEAQTLTTGAEENLLKLAQLIGAPTDEENARWAAICEDYRRYKKLGGAQGDGATRIAALLADIGVTLDAVRRQLASPPPGAPDWQQELSALRATIAAVQAQVSVDVAESPAISTIVSRLADTYEKGIAPLVNATYHKLKLDHDMWERLRDMATDLKRLDSAFSKSAGVANPAAKSTAKARRVAGENEGEGA